ncbi:photosystem II D1 precursor processing protein PSB27-H2, chloroplastic isoform X1 [Tripterygium wilfordii]|uniref:photosystem II D1 precursor processing protein PSB27-H2, chloroplastic isoform X1 n=2 Tax=Tripterygium wilfordii TaxID=458696 RepID=UPI0018F81350|nr:photosystem II D1 precursor processing protein PSB27-H2, chloroplastic isoform X1 [Tripterygium wilfordii]
MRLLLLFEICECSSAVLVCDTASRMAVMLAGCNGSLVKTVGKILKPDLTDTLPVPHVLLAASSRRHVLVCTSASIFTILAPGLTALPVLAEEKLVGQDEKDEGVIGAVKSLFDPNEKTKSGKVLPKAYLKSAREVVKTLRDSLKEDPKDILQFRRTADSAKESIREYLGSWRGQEKVVHEESYAILEKAIRSLASFYSKAGPSAPLSEEVKSEILNDLSTAEEFL